MAKVTAAKSRTKGPKRRVTHVRIHHAKNGYTVHHELEPQKKRSPGGGMSPSYSPDDSPEPMVFNDKQAMLDHVGGLADQMGPDQGAPEQG